MIRITFVSPGSTPIVDKNNTQPIGGAEVQMYLLARQISFNENFASSLVIHGKQSLIKEGKLNIYVIPFFTDAKRFWVRIFERIVFIVPQLKFWAGLKTDIIVQRSAGLFTLYVWIYCKLKKIKFVYMIAHDWDTSWEKNPLNSQWWWRWYWMALSKADLIVTQNDYQSANIKKLNVSFLQIENGLPLDLLDKLSRNLPKNRDCIYISTRFTSQKQPLMFLDLVKQFPEFEFTVVGFDCGEEKILKEFKSRLGSLNNLHWIKGLSWQNKFTQLACHKMFVSTSIREGYPNTYLEALALKLPVVSLNVDPNGLLKKSHGGVCANGNWKKFTNQISGILADKPLIDKMGADGQKYVRKFNNIADNAAILEKFLCTKMSI